MTALGQHQQYDGRHGPGLASRWGCRCIRQTLAADEAQGRPHGATCRITPRHMALFYPVTLAGGARQQTRPFSIPFARVVPRRLSDRRLPVLPRFQRLRPVHLFLQRGVIGRTHSLQHSASKLSDAAKIRHVERRSSVTVSMNQHIARGTEKHVPQFEERPSPDER